MKTWNIGLFRNVPPDTRIPKPRNPRSKLEGVLELCLPRPFTVPDKFLRGYGFGFQGSSFGFLVSGVGFRVSGGYQGVLDALVDGEQLHEEVVEALHLPPARPVQLLQCV